MSQGSKLVEKLFAKLCRGLVDRRGRFSVVIMVNDMQEGVTHCATAGLTFVQFNEMWRRQDEFFRSNQDAVKALCEHTEAFARAHPEFPMRGPADFGR